jgi:hypothetical protein
MNGKWKSRKTFIIFITGLHNNPQGCGASVASAAGPFNKKNRDHITKGTQKSLMEPNKHIQSK